MAHNTDEEEEESIWSYKIKIYFNRTVLKMNSKYVT